MRILLSKHSIFLFTFALLIAGLPNSCALYAKTDSSQQACAKALRAVVVVAGYSSGGLFLPELRGPHFKENQYAILHLDVDADEFTKKAKIEGYDGRLALQIDPVTKKILNIDEVLRFLEPYDVQAVIAGSDPGNFPADFLAAHFGTGGNSPDTTAQRRVKSEILAAVERAGLQVPKQILATSEEDVVQFMQQNPERPIVLKPDEGGGSVDVSFAYTIDEAKSFFRTIMQKPDAYGNANRHVLVQKFLGRSNERGELESLPEFIVETIATKTRDGRILRKVAAIFAYQKMKVAGHTINYAADLLPSIETLDPNSALAKNLIKLRDHAFQVEAAIGHEVGVVHHEIMLDTNDSNARPIQMEVGQRPAGSKIPLLIQAATGYNEIRDILNAHLHPEIFETELHKIYPLQKHARRIIIRSLEAGRRFSSSGIEDALRAPLTSSGAGGGSNSPLNRIFWWHKDGEVVKATENLGSSLGVAFLVHEDPEMIEQFSQRLLQFEESGRMYLPMEEMAH